MPRYRMTIAYEGTDFCGWQKQEPPAPPASPATPSGDADTAGPAPHASRAIPAHLTTDRITDDRGRERLILRTVQQEVETAVRAVVRQPVVIVGASRTDSGVHAWHQTAAFTCEGETGRPPDDRLALALNARLPGDILVRGCVRTRDDFNPIGDCIAKGYRYSFHTSPDRPLWDRRLVKHLWASLDEHAMDVAARVLVGEHDFAAFAAAGHGRESTVRRVLDCRAVRTAPDRVHIDVSASGFLWNMVRIIAGTLMEVGLGRKSAEDVRAALESKDRRRAGPTVGPEGLCLMWGRYPEDASDEKVQDNKTETG